MKSGLAVVSTKNPTAVLGMTISGIKNFYPEFDIVIIDSDSTDMSGFQLVPSDVKIEFSGNKNFELGAYSIAFSKYNSYDVYMFIQDSYTPISRIANFHISNFSDSIFYSAHLRERLSFLVMPEQERLHDVYKDTDLNFLPNFSDYYTLATNNSFITSKCNIAHILQLENAYTLKNIRKTKMDACTDERTIGIMADGIHLVRVDLTEYFHKRHLARE